MGSIKGQKRFKCLLYIITMLTLLTVILPVIQVGNYTHSGAKKLVEEVVGGKVIIDAEGEILEHQLNLNGEWLCHEGVYLYDESEIKSKIKAGAGQLSVLPEVDLQTSKGQRTYQLFLEIHAEQDLMDALALSIEFTNDSVNVFLNRVELESFRPMKSWIGGESTYNVYVFGDAYDKTSQFQEILISVNENPEGTDLYRREVSLGTLAEIIEQTKTSDVLQMFLVGLMILSIIMGLIYLVVMPRYSVLTFMNLFDTALMLYIYYSTSRIPGVVSSYSLGEFQDSFMRGQALMLMFFAGALGNILGQVIYDPERETCTWFNAPVNALWFGMAFYFAVCPEQYNDICLYGTLLLLGVNFIGLVNKIWNCYRSAKWNGYMAFHLVKTVFVAGIIVWDVSTLNTYPRNETAIVLGYVIYFTIHLVIRAYEYMIPFKEIERHNEGLELAVQERTEQLMAANEILREINVKDGLTKAHNRLYFEELLEEAIENYNGEPREDGLYLCVFDLDDFKVINDTYGHNVGDEQLIELVELVKTIIPEDVKVSRIGGEEFTLLFDGYYEDVVLENVREIRKRLEKMSTVEGRTSGSFGVTKYSHKDTRKEFFIKADKCLYHAKASGKNCISHDFRGEIIRESK